LLVLAFLVRPLLLSSSLSFFFPARGSSFRRFQCINHQPQF
jgi:hypothetical protein